MEDIECLAELLKQRNAIDKQIAQIINRPALTGHIGEYIASRIFDIKLAGSATNVGHDGCFSSGLLENCTVNVKFYGKRENLLDFPLESKQGPDLLPHYYLVLTGPRSPALSSKGMHRPSVIETIFLFDAVKLIQALKTRAANKQKTAKIGTATSVPEEFWFQAEIYPSQRNNLFRLAIDQQRLLALFK